MSNPCRNDIYAYSESSEIIELLLKKLDKSFNLDLYEHSEDHILGYFESNWTMPEEIMKDITDSLPKDDSLFIRIMSIEYGLRYHEMWFYENGIWICD